MFYFSLKKRCYYGNISMRPNFQTEWKFFNTDPLQLIMCLNVHYYCTCFQLCFTPKQKENLCWPTIFIMLTCKLIMSTYNIIVLTWNIKKFKVNIFMFSLRISKSHVSMKSTKICYHRNDKRTLYATIKATKKVRSSFI